MTMNAFPNLVPSTTSQLQQNFNQLFSQFGGGYVQIGAAGINPSLPTWSLEFDNLSSTDSATLETFLNANAYAFFTWTPPSGNGSVWYINQAANSSGFTKTNNGLVNSYQFSITAMY